MNNSKLILLILVFISCSTEDKKKFTITDFSKIKIDTLKPSDNKSYVAYYIKLRGNVNDSVKIQRKGYYDVILTGQIDTLINGDYYGGENVVFIFNPYRAKKGRLEIEYGL